MTVQKRSVLGKGLGALLSSPNLGQGPEQFQFVAAELIEANPFQPRDHFDEKALAELAESIGIHGLIQPITLRQVNWNPSRYQLISGERRLRASKLAGLAEVPAYIRTANDQQMLEMALIENIQRENLNAIEVALSYQRLIEECKLNQEDLGSRVGKDRSTVTNYLRLLRLPPDIQVGLREGKIGMGHAKSILSAPHADAQLDAYRTVVEEGLSVRATEALLKNYSSAKRIGQQSQGGIVAGKGPQKLGDTPRNSPHYTSVKAKLEERLEARVRVNPQDDGAGTIEIHFASTDELNRILDLLDV